LGSAIEAVGLDTRNSGRFTPEGYESGIPKPDLMGSRALLRKTIRFFSRALRIDG